nr:uncharacterized protein LOC107434286 [Ziziphus jujuba var. spinosa]
MSSPPKNEDKNLYKLTMQHKWKDIVEIYKENPRAHKMRITHKGGTALHLAVIERRKDIVSELVQEISKKDKGALEIQNDRGDTPLHNAASVGCEIMCKYIVKASNPSLIGIRTKNTEIALFIAAINGNNEAFLFLHKGCSEISDSNDCYSYTRRSNNGDNILHAAINNEHFELPYKIIHLYGDLVNSVNEKGLTPFHCLDKSSAFKSCSYDLGLWKRLIYQCIVVKEIKFEDRKNVVQNWSQSTIPSNEMQGIFPAIFDKFVKELKKKHKWSVQIMDELFKRSEFIYKHRDAGMKKGKLSSEEEDEDDDMEEVFKGEATRDGRN